MERRIGFSTNGCRSRKLLVAPGGQQAPIHAGKQTQQTKQQKRVNVCFTIFLNVLQTSERRVRRPDRLLVGGVFEYWISD